MICPQCDGDYRDGFTHCATCQVDLIPGSQPNEYHGQGTPALIAGLLLAVGITTLYLTREAEGALVWYVAGGTFVLFLIAWIIRARFKV